MGGIFGAVAAVRGLLGGSRPLQLPEPPPGPDAPDFAEHREAEAEVVRWWTRTAPSGPQPPSAPAPPGALSYSSTFDTAVACLPCAQQHTSGADAAAQSAAQAAARGDIAAAKLDALRAVGEVAAFRLFDLTPDKLAATAPDALRAIQDTMPDLDALAHAVPTPPAPLVAAYAAVAEAPRFARGAPTAADRQEIASRVLPALQWCGEIERVTLSPDRMAALAPQEHAAAERALDEIRAARHAIGSPDAAPSAGALEQASAHLLTAATLLAPDPTPEQVQQMAEAASRASQALDGHLRAKILSAGLGG